jgi:uncharacterized low-complexity protein
MNTQLTYYQSAKQALSMYKSVDEVKEYRDKAKAVEQYAKEANDHDLEHDAALARIRAERKCGELLRDMEKAKRGPDKNGNGQRSQQTTPEQSKTLSEMGVTKDQSSKWQKLANIPEAEFESAVSLPGAVPSTNKLVRETKEPVRMDKNALWLWGTLRDIRRLKVMDNPASYYVDEWTQAMHEDADSILYNLREWIK